MAVEDRVAAHYTTGALLDRIKAGLVKLGIDPEHPTAADLKACDEFHTGGAEATDALLAQLTITPQTKVLDIGSGIGGPARLIADRYGAHVTCVDLTQEFVDTAAELTRLTGLSHLTDFRQGSALDLPVPGGAFDLALLLHVGMNIPDKPRLFAEAHRALKPGGIFAVFDVMRGPNPEPPVFPLPWSAVPENSFLETPETYRAAATAAGFEITAERDCRDFAIAFFEKVFARIEAEGPPVLSIGLMMGETAGEKLGNYLANVEARRLGPVELICRVPA